MFSLDSTDTVLLWMGGLLSGSAFVTACAVVKVALKKVGELGNTEYKYQRIFASIAEGDHAA